MKDTQFDLQFFAAEDEGRTEEPTARKISKAREKGQVAKSHEIPQALMMLFGFLFLSLVSPYVLNELFSFSRYIIEHLHKIDLSEEGFLSLLIMSIFVFFKIVLPIMFVSCLVACLGSFLQVGFIFTLQPLTFDLSKLIPRPEAILKRLWISKMTAWNLLKAVVYVVVIGYFSYQVIRKNYGTILLTMNWDILPAISFFSKLALEIIIKAALILLIVSLLDYCYQRHEYIESLKMTKQEVKDEYRMMEGDPLIKGAIRRRQREVSMRRMMQEVPKADVVITNPIHIAVALKYDPSYMMAPIVVAKGEDLMAERIVKAAYEFGIPVIENKPLAQALYESTEIGDEIPPELYRAVAEVLAYVYQTKGERAKAG